MSEQTEKDKDELILLRVVRDDNWLVKVQIKKSTPLGRLMTVYCNRAGLEMAETRFRCNGQAVNETDTALSLKLQSEDVIEIYHVQTGGGCPHEF